MKLEQQQRMYDTLKRLAGGYKSLNQLRRDSEKQYGLEYHEALEYAYENIQQDAKNALKGLRRPKP